jgi:hypothetical protein
MLPRMRESQPKLCNVHTYDKEKREKGKEKLRNGRNLETQ